MKPTLKLALVFIIISIGLHFYLSSHYYGVLYGAAEAPSACNINSTLNCDAVAASSYSSLFGIPLSTLGAFTNLALLLLLLFYTLGFTSDRKLALKYSYWLAGFVALSSVVMLIVAVTQLSVYCIFCFALYLLSFITFICIHKGLDEKPKISEIGTDLIQLFTEHRQVLGTLILVPVLSLFTHKSMLDGVLGGQSKRFERIMKNSIANWENAQPIDFSTVRPSAVKGNELTSTSMSIVEFADFRCGHCKKASHSLAAFVRTHKDVQLKFYNFPLDGACNKVITHNNGVSCRLAKATHCGTEQDLGWEVHDAIFFNQKDFFNATSSSDTDNKLKTHLAQLSLDWDKLVTCMDSEATHRTISDQAALGERSGVKGTPAIYVNGKKLPMGQNLKVLSQVREKILSK